MFYELILPSMKGKGLLPYQPHGNVIVIFIKHRPELFTSSQYILGQRENIPSPIHGAETPVDLRLKEGTISQFSSHDGGVIQPASVILKGRCSGLEWAWSQQPMAFDSTQNTMVHKSSWYYIHRVLDMPPWVLSPRCIVPWVKVQVSSPASASLVYRWSWNRK